MKENKFIRAGALIVAAMTFLNFSCSKKGEVPESSPDKQEIKFAPEQEKQTAEIKKGIAESKKIVVSRVNGAEITMFELVKEMNSIASRYAPAGQPTTPETTALVKKEALDRLIFRELAVQEAKQRGMSVSSEAINEIVGKVKTQAGSEAEYQKYLQERNLDEPGLRKIIERSQLFEIITAREIFEKIRIDEQTLRETYVKEKATFMSKDNPPRQLAFEEVKDHIVRRIKSERSGKLMADWDKELVKKAKIEIIPEK